MSGAATSFPMTTLPRRASRDVRLFAGSPLAIIIAVLFFAGAASTLAWFPREVAAARRSFRTGGRGRTAADAGSKTSEFQRAEAAVAAARAARRPDRRGEGAGGEVQRLPVPGLRPVVPAVQADLREVRSRASRRGQVGAEGLPAEPRLQRRAGAVHTLGGMQGPRSPIPDGPRRGTTRPRRSEDWLYTHQQEMTPPSVRQTARDVGQILDCRRQYQSDPPAW